MNELTVEKDATQGTSAPPARRRWRWIGAGAFVLLLLVLAYAYLHVSRTYAENSDEANILLMADDMLHGNFLLHGWYVSDVPFITTELPEIAFLVGVFGLHLDTAHIAAALTYTLVIAGAMLLAKGDARGWKAVTRMGVVVAIMLAPQPGVGVFVIVYSVGHIGTSLPVMLTWLVLDRGGRRRWVPVVVAVMLAWAETADPLVLVIAIFPMLAVCLVRLVRVLVTGMRPGNALSPHDTGSSRIRAVLSAGWFELALAFAAGVGYAIAWGAGKVIEHFGYTLQPVPFKLDSPGQWYMQARIVVNGLLEMFGANFVPGPQTAPTGVAAPGGLDQVIAFSRLAVVVLAIWGACAIARRFFRKDADFVSQLLLAGIVLNLAAYIPSTLADHSALNTREIAPVLPFAAVLAARMLGDRLLRKPIAGPRIRIRVRGRRLGVRVTAVCLVVLMGWYGFGLWQQADAPPAPTPYASLVSYMESHHLSYGLGGYWQAGVITVESGGKVTIRAVTPACIQPYQWESKTEWYDPSQNKATFLLLSNAKGYFTQFGVSSATLLLLNSWYKDSRSEIRPVVEYRNGNPIFSYEIRSYGSRANLLALGPRLKSSIKNPSQRLLKELKGASPAPCT